MNTKQVVVIRKDLNMRKGKMVAQGGHGVLGVILNKMNGGHTLRDKCPDIINGKYTLTLEVEVNSPLDVWLRGQYTKICVSVNSENELLEVYEKAKNQGLPVSLIQDSGLTEFGGVKTYTCIVIGPEQSEKIDTITGHLPLL